MNLINVCIIGAGVSGLTAARILQDKGVQVTVFEKSRGVGGRMATRRLDEKHSSFDHGAQYFTAREPRFINFVNSWLDQGIVARWPSREPSKNQSIAVLKAGTSNYKPSSEDRFVAVPAMNQICKVLAENLIIEKNVRVKNILSEGATFHLVSEAGDSLGQFDKVVVSTPAFQASELLANFPQLSSRLSKIEMRPCWATMAAFSDPLTDKWVGAFIDDSLLSWASRNNTKPGRNPDQEHIVLHANPEWTSRHWDSDPEWTATAMLTEFWNVSGIEPKIPTYLTSHRWRYAAPTEPLKPVSYTAGGGNIICCGDWTHGGRVEGAVLSGLSAAETMLEGLSGGGDTILR